MGFDLPRDSLNFPKGRNFILTRRDPASLKEGEVDVNRVTEESSPYFFKKDSQTRKRYLKEQDVISRAYKDLSNERAKE